MSPLPQLGEDLETGERCYLNFGVCQGSTTLLQDEELRTMLTELLEGWKKLAIVPDEKERQFWNAWTAIAKRQQASLAEREAPKLRKEGTASQRSSRGYGQAVNDDVLARDIRS